MFFAILRSEFGVSTIDPKWNTSIRRRRLPRIRFGRHAAQGTEHGWLSSMPCCACSFPPTSPRPAISPTSKSNGARRRHLLTVRSKRLERRDPAVGQLDLDRGGNSASTDLGRHRCLADFPDSCMVVSMPRAPSRATGWRRARRQRHGDSRHGPMPHAFMTVRFSHLHPSLPDFSADILGSFCQPRQQPQTCFATALL